MPERRDAVDTIDWSSMTDGCDRPSEIPALVHAMWSTDPEMRRQAYDGLVSHLVHQGSRYDASAAAVPFLIDVVADPQAPDRFAACQVLRAVAIGDESYWLTERPDVAAVRHEVARKAALSREELERERAAWVAAAPDEQVRRDRELTAIYNDVETDREAERWDMEAYDAVRAGVPVYVAALESDHPGTRLYASHLLAWFPEERDTIIPALIRVIRHDEDAMVAATACVAAGLCGATGDTALIGALSTRRRTSENRAERWSAVIGLAEVTPRPDPELLDELYECLAGATEPVPYWPFLDGDMASVAALTIARLGPELAAERVDILTRRLAHPADVSDGFTFVGALLEAAFPDGGVPAGATFADLTEPQRAAVRALENLAVWDGDAMFSMLLDKYNMPSEHTALQRWMSGGGQ